MSEPPKTDDEQAQLSLDSEPPTTTHDWLICVPFGDPRFVDLHLQTRTHVYEVNIGVMVHTTEWMTTALPETFERPVHTIDLPERASQFTPKALTRFFGFLHTRLMNGILTVDLLKELLLVDDYFRSLPSLGLKSLILHTLKECACRKASPPDNPNVLGYAAWALFEIVSVVSRYDCVMAQCILDQFMNDKTIWLNMHITNEIVPLPVSLSTNTKLVSKAMHGWIHFTRAVQLHLNEYGNYISNDRKQWLKWLLEHYGCVAKDFVSS